MFWSLWRSHVYRRASAWVALTSSRHNEHYIHPFDQGIRLSGCHHRCVQEKMDRLGS